MGLNKNLLAKFDSMSENRFDHQISANLKACMLEREKLYAKLQSELEYRSFLEQKIEFLQNENIELNLERRTALLSNRIQMEAMCNTG